MKSRKLILIVLLSLSVFSALYALDTSDSSWSVAAAPDFFLPIVTGNFEPNEILNASWGGSLSAERKLGTSLPLSLGVGGSYTVAGLLPVEGIDVAGTLSEAALTAGMVYNHSLAARLGLFSFVDGGVIYGRMSTGTDTFYGIARAGAGFDFLLSDSLSARLKAAAVYKFGLALGFGAGIGVNYYIPESSKSPGMPAKSLEFYSIEIENLFPSLRSQYEEKPIGFVSITNNGKKTLQNLRVSFTIPQYMDTPRDSYTIERLAPGESEQVPLYALFNDGVLDITESTKVAGQILVSYNGVEESRGTTVLIYDRNALTWSDDRKAAAFVSSKDPWVMDLSGNILATVMPERNPELPGNLQTAIAVHEGLRAYGISYMLSPNRPFAKAVVDTTAVDTLKYPRQTLGFRAGDCADLSVLYASCFEAVGIESAFVTVPGHIFVAVSLGLDESQAADRGMNMNELIVYNDKVWLPIETTMRGSGFGEVWRKAAEQWRTASKSNQAAFYPVHEAWESYAPVGLPADRSTVSLPNAAELLKNFKAECSSAVNRELSARIALLRPLEKGPSYAKAANDRGVLYAKYGFYDEASKYFKDSVNNGSTSAMVNLGNLSMLKSDAATAFEYFRKAAVQLPNNAKLQINLAKAAAALGNQKEVDAAMAQLRNLDPQMADQYASVAVVSGSDSAGTRASEAESEVLWF